MAAQNELSSWYNSLPLLSKYWLTADIVLPMAARLGLIDIRSLILESSLVWNKFHIWRPITALACFPIEQAGFHYLMMLYFLYQYSTRLEKEDFAGKPADMAYMLLIIFSTSIGLGFLLKMMILFEIPIIAVLYVWCQLNKDMSMQFFFGVRVKAQYLPWVLCIFNMIIKGGGMVELLGIFVGHLYYFLKFRYSQEFGGPYLLETPRWLLNYFPSVRQTGGFGPQPTSSQPDNSGAGGPFLGRGRRLGD